MGLIYVNPEAPTASPTRPPRHATFATPSAACDERRRDGGVDRRRSQLGKRTARVMRSWCSMSRNCGIELQAWLEEHLRHRQGKDAITSGLEVPGPPADQVGNNFFENLFGLRVELTRAPPVRRSSGGPRGMRRGHRARCPDATLKKIAPSMCDDHDIALRVDRLT